MKWLVVVLLALAVPATAGNWINKSEVVAHNGRTSIVNTFYQGAGDCEVDAIYGTDVALGDEPTVADSVDVAIDSGGMPGWLILTIPEEANLDDVFVQFKESVDGDTHSYAWGDIQPCYVGGAQYNDTFNVGLWDSCKIHLAGSAYGKVNVYWRIERISD